MPGMLNITEEELSAAIEEIKMMPPPTAGQIAFSQKLRKALREIASRGTTWDQVAGYDNQYVVSAFAAEFELTHADAQKLFHSLKQYFFLCLHCKEGSSCIAPEWIGKAWRVFASESEMYSDFCAVHLGHYVVLGER